MATPLVAPLQWLLPEAPVILGSMLAVTWSLILYELVHVAEHLSYEKFWKSKIFHPRYGRFFTKIYAFHVRHHANVKCNDAVGGFFGIPIPDFLFKTYLPSRAVLIHGVPADERDVAPPVPCWFIRILDRIAAKRMQKIQAAS